MADVEPESTGRSEFEKLVRVGRGKAVQILEREDPTPYREIIVEACLHSQAFDVTVEGDRTEYLRDLIRLSGDPAYVRNRIIAALQTTRPDGGEDERFPDLDQLLDLTLSFAREGDEAARAALYACFDANAATPSLDWEALSLGAQQIVTLDGVAGFLYVAERLGERALAEEGYFIHDFGLGLDEEGDDAKADREKVKRARRENAAVDAYLEAVEKSSSGFVRANRPDWRALSYDEIRSGYDSAGRRVSIVQLRRWGEHADEQAIEALARDLLEENDPDRILYLVHAYDRRSFPLDPAPLIRLLWGEVDSPAWEDNRLAWVVAGTLANTRHPEIRRAALSLMEDPARRAHGVRLLARNYEPGDHAIVERALAACEETDDAGAYHQLGWAALEVATANPVPECAPLLVSLYMREPCTNCREKSFELLSSMGLLPGWMIEESRHDAKPALRQRALSLGR